MRIAALTYVYNEKINLPIWLKYYGLMFGLENLFILDRESDDGSCDKIQPSNKITIPRTDFDDIKKINAISYMHSVLLQSYDCVLVSDCDEIVVPDPDNYKNLSEYINNGVPSVSACLGINIIHNLTTELPLDLDSPILSQRRFGRFDVPTSKPLISSVATKWAPGGHMCDILPMFDKNLFVFHNKWMDYGFAMQRQVLNNLTPWTKQAIEKQHGAHHRYDFNRFVRESFLDLLNEVQSKNVATFEFEKEISIFQETTKLSHGFYHYGDLPPKYVEIPSRFRDVF